MWFVIQKEITNILNKQYHTSINIPNICIFSISHYFIALVLCLQSTLSQAYKDEISLSLSTWFSVEGQGDTCASTDDSQKPCEAGDQKAVFHVIPTDPNLKQEKLETETRSWVAQLSWGHRGDRIGCKGAGKVSTRGRGGIQEFIVVVSKQVAASGLQGLFT